MEHIVKWWTQMASKRYTKMVSENRLRRELEVWNQDSMNKIDIIR